MSMLQAMRNPISKMIGIPKKCSHTCPNVHKPPDTYRFFNEKKLRGAGDVDQWQSLPSICKAVETIPSIGS